MKTRKLGNTDIEIAPIIFGGNVFGWSANEETSFALLDKFLASGFNCIDTADVYSSWVPGNKGGESETIIGQWLKRNNNRKNVVLLTKVGMELSPEKNGLSKSYIIAAVEDSLRRLQTDYIDLYQSHQDDFSIPLEETLEAYALLIKQGKVRAIGASNYSAQRLSESVKISKQKELPRYQTLQPKYNIYDRSVFEKELESTCVENKIGVIPYYSLASGFLTGKYQNEKDLAKSSVRGSRVKQYLNERGFKIIAALNKVAEKYNATCGQIALAWLLARPSITAPIASATNLNQLQEMLNSTHISLDAESISFLNTASA
ncbi:MAG: aldo/keto reductase [Bdellovibrionota bacterium]